MELKYVRHDVIGFILWPRNDDLWHSHIGKTATANVEGRLVSAGFATLDGGVVRCYGRSESLSLKCRPDDAEALAQQLGLRTLLGSVRKPAGATP